MSEEKKETMNGDVQAWDKLAKMMENKEVFTVQILGTVKAGVVTYVEGIRAFIPASRLAAGYVENLDEYLEKEIDVTIITVEADKKRLVLSGREAARKKRNAERSQKVDAVAVGTVLSGTVETIKDYGVFVKLENGLSGLVHVSQMSVKRVKSPADVVSVGDTVQVKVISVANHKLSLSMKALLVPEEPVEEKEEVFNYKEEGKASTGLGDLLKNFKLD
jgi:small subunit ribosomal protein S1